MRFPLSSACPEQAAGGQADVERKGKQKKNAGNWKKGMNKNEWGSFENNQTGTEKNAYERLLKKQAGKRSFKNIRAPDTQ